jgi:lysophospholipase L1-like esterase
MNKVSRFLIGMIVVAGLTLYGGVASAAHPRTPTQYYLALGDSVALGYQTPDIPTDRGCMDATSDAAGQRGYVCVLWRQLKETMRGIKLASLALAISPGEDTCSFLAVTDCLGDKSRTAVAGDKPPYNINSTSQLKAALAFIRGHHVSVITLTLGGNDFLPLLHIAETKGVATAKKLLPGVESRLSTNMQAIVGTLRVADPTAKLVLTDQYNPLSGLPASALGPQGGQILTLAQQELEKLASGYQLLAAATGSIYAPVYQQFVGKGAELTWITVGQNIHPDADGYLLIAKVIWASYLDATVPVTASVHASKPVIRAGQKEKFAISTLPSASVTLTLTYQQDGWQYHVSRMGTADLEGAYQAVWTAANVSGKVAVKACASLPRKNAACARTSISVK